MSGCWPKRSSTASTRVQRSAMGTEAARSMRVALSSVPRRRATFPAPCAWPQMGSMAPQRPLRTAKPVTLAKL
uniref:Uncharacterized protein n=1 Tax=Zea mays TaxID=4577 RepID=B6TU55_MAIZE|nr:hypothetical protein [Zea mays]